MNENERQYIHMFASLALIFVVFAFGRGHAIALLFVALILGSVIVNQKILGKKIPIADGLIRRFERKKTRFPGYGSAWFVSGCLFALIFTNNLDYSIALIWVLGIGDGVSTLFGRNGKHKWFYNKEKTIEGSVAFALFSILSYYWIGPLAFPLAIVCAAGESVKLPIDDNIVIPVLGVLFLGIFG